MMKTTSKTGCCVAVNECHNLRKKNGRIVSMETMTEEPSYYQTDDDLDVS